MPCGRSISGAKSGSRCCCTTRSIIRWRSGARSAPAMSHCRSIPSSTWRNMPTFSPTRAHRRWWPRRRWRRRSGRSSTGCRICAPSSWSALRPRTWPPFPAATCICSRTSSRKPVPRRSPPIRLSDEVAFWMYTSGSTGDPKGVKHVHSNLMATAKLFGQGVLGISGSDVVHSAAKLFFSYGLGNAMIFPLSVGATTVLWPPRPTPDGVFEIMRKHRPTIFFGVPSLYTACSRTRTSAKAPAPTACASACRRAKRCPPISASAGARSSAVTCSTASAPPKCCKPS